MGPHQLLEGGLVQIALQGELAQSLPGGLEGLHLHRVTLQPTLVTDRTAGHQGRARQTLQVLEQNNIESYIYICKQ